MGRLSLAAAAAVGYVFGTRAGRERYEQIKSQFNRVRKDPRVQKKTSEAEHLFKTKASEAASVAKDKARAAGAEPGNNEGPDNRQPAPPQGI